MVMHTPEVVNGCLCRYLESVQIGVLPENGNFTDIIHHVTVIAKHRQCHAYLTGGLPICLADGSLKIFYNSKL